MRSSQDRVLAGVCGGLAAYMNLDPTLVRVLYVVLSLFTVFFPGFLLYIILALIVPSEDSVPRY
jgi:phage shock protein C